MPCAPWQQTHAFTRQQAHSRCGCVQADKLCLLALDEVASLELPSWLPLGDAAALVDRHMEHLPEGAACRPSVVRCPRCLAVHSAAGPGGDALEWNTDSSQFSRCSGQDANAHVYSSGCRLQPSWDTLVCAAAGPAGPWCSSMACACRLHIRGSCLWTWTAGSSCNFPPQCCVRSAPARTASNELTW